MKVVLVPGPRNEKLISLIKYAKEANPDEAWEALQEYEVTEEYMDALFYACQNGEEMLREQCEYFQYALLNEENEYFFERMMADFTHQCNLETLATEVDKNRGVAALMWVRDYKTHLNQRIIIAIQEHAEGWDYYLLTPGYCSIEDGVYDEACPIRKFLSNQFNNWGFLCNQEMTLLGIDETIENCEEFGGDIGWEYLGR